MLKKAIEYIVEMSKPTIEGINGQVYSDKELYRISHNPKASALSLSTLTGLVEYIKQGVDREKRSDTMVVHVVSPTKVRLFSPLDSDCKRDNFVDVEANIPQFRFGNFCEHEEFCIAMQSKFVDSPGTDRALVLKFAGTVEAGTVAEYGDDGVTQKATVKTGIASKGDALVPNPVLLAPYRTFVEVAQPTSQFVFRMKQDSRGAIVCALFEADGGAWEREAMNAISRYLAEELKDIPGIVILA